MTTLSSRSLLDNLQHASTIKADMKNTTKTRKVSSAARGKTAKTSNRPSKATKAKASKIRSLPVRHARTLLRITPRFVHGMVVGAFLGFMLLSVLRSQNNASALSVTVTRNCDNNSVIYCGALTTAELQQRYSQAGVATIYSYFGISAQDIKNIDSIAKVGEVTKTNEVIVGGKVVATNAVTVGRENVNPSTHKEINGVNFYLRPPSVNFLSSSIPAFVAFSSSGQFRFAILGSCGNSVSGTPVPQPTPTKPTPVPTPKPTPAPTIPTTPLTPTTVLPTPQTITTAAEQVQPQSLPNTGPGAVIIVVGAAVVCGYLFHMTHRHLRNKHKQRTHHHGNTPHPSY